MQYLKPWQQPVVSGPRIPTNVHENSMAVCGRESTPKLSNQENVMPRQAHIVVLILPPFIWGQPTNGGLTNRQSQGKECSREFCGQSYQPHRFEDAGATHVVGMQVLYTLPIF